MGLRALLILALCIAPILLSFKKPHIGILFFAFITYVRPERFSYDQLAVLRIPLLLSLCALIGWLIQRRDSVSVRNPSKVLMFLFCFAVTVMALSPFAAYDSRLSFDYAFDIFKIVIFCFLVIELIDSEEKLKWFLIVNLVGASFIALWGIEQHFRGNIRLEDMAGGLFAESNSCATLFVIVAPFFFSMIFGGKSMTIRLVGKIMSLALLCAIVFTQSRAGLLGFAAAFMVYFCTIPLKQKAAFVLIGILFLYPAFRLASTDAQGYEERLESMSSEDALNDRLNIWRAGKAVFYDHWLTGVGQQNFQYLAKSYFVQLGLPVTFKERADPHNTLLLVLCEGGVLALFFFTLSILAFLMDIIRLRRDASPFAAEYRPAITAMLAGMTGFMVCGMFHSYPLWEPFYWLLVIPGALRRIMALKQQTEYYSEYYNMLPGKEYV